MLKEQKGITLVALVITIIVLLILAGVSISIALDDNGIFKQSQNATNLYKEEAGKEQNTLNETANTMNTLFTEYAPKAE